MSLWPLTSARPSRTSSLVLPPPCTTWSQAHPPPGVDISNVHEGVIFLQGLIFIEDLHLEGKNDTMRPGSCAPDCQGGSPRGLDVSLQEALPYCACDFPSRLSLNLLVGRGKLRSRSPREPARPKGPP